MDRALEEIKNFFEKNKTSTIAQLQQEFNLAYKAARAALAVLEEDGIVARDGGMSFRYLEASQRQVEDRDADPSPRFNVKEIALEMHREPLIKETIAYCVEKGKQRRTSCIELQVRFQLSKGRAFGLLDRMIDLGVFSENGDFLLSEEECRTILGNKEENALQEAIAERRRELMRKLDEVMGSRDREEKVVDEEEEDEPTDDHVDSKELEEAKRRFFARLEADRRAIEGIDEEPEEKPKKKPFTPLIKKKEADSAIQLDVWALIDPTTKKEGEGEKGASAVTDGAKKTPKKKKKKK